MSTLPLNKIEEAARRLYHHHQILDNFPPGFTQEGEVDEATETLYVRIRSKTINVLPVNYHRSGNKCYGQHAFSNRWLKIQPTGQFPHYLQSAVRLLTKQYILSVTDEGECWNVEVKTDALPFQTDPEGFFRTIFKGRKGTEQRHLYDQMVEMARNVRLAVRIWVHQKSFEIAKLLIHSRTSRTDCVITVTFRRSESAIPPLPRNALTAPDKDFPLMTLFVPMYRVGGWCEVTHRLLSQRAIALTKETDQDERYNEIYAEEWGSTDPDNPEPANYQGPTEDHHPIIIGAHYEDRAGEMPGFYDTWLAPTPKEFFNTKHLRDYHHYGGEASGLKHQPYFTLDNRDGGAPPPEVGVPPDSYYSARDWGYGGGRIDPPLNRLTFSEAIKQYGRYSFEGKRNAYLMLGHVVHLLQDQAQPDHASLVAHQGSSYTEPEAYEKFHVFEIIPGQIAAIYFASCCAACGWWCPVCGVVCGGEAYAIAYGILKAALDEDKMGFERLIKDHWFLQRIENRLKGEGIETCPSYDAYFSEMAGFSKERADERRLSSPIGMQWFPLLFLFDAIFPITIPDLLIPPLDPEIDYPDESDSYFQLMDEVSTRAISLSAGLIRHFFEVVNYPPFLERAVIVRAAQGLTPDRFAHFQECPDATVVYDVFWSNVTRDNTLINRTKTERAKRALCAGQNVYVFLIFGPSIFPLRSKAVDGLTLTLVGQSPEGEPIQTPVELDRAPDSELGQYYWGCFKPDEFASRQKYTLTMHIQARDTSAHYRSRDASGDVLDSDPETVARVDATDPRFGFTGYEPGEDLNHSFEVAPSITQDTFEPNDTLDNAWPIELRGQKNAVEIVASVMGQSDLDFFRIDWNTIHLGDFGSYFVAAVNILVSENFGNTLCLKFYGSDRSLLRSTNKRLCVEFFPMGLLADTTLFVEVENPNFYCQGALEYTLSAGYALIPVKPLPALIDKWWWLLPPDERRIQEKDYHIRYLDWELLVEDLERVLPILEAAWTGSRKEWQVEMARLQSDIGRIAEKMGLARHAERLYVESSTLFGRSGEKAQEAEVLRSLQRFYVARGYNEEAVKLFQRLNRIK